MQQREVESHVGTRLIIFQCPECSGVWVDGDVVFRVSRDSALEVDSDAEFEEISTKPRETPALCPRCGTNLLEQTGGGLPEGLRLDYCTDCHGFWFDKGELMIYKSFQESKRRRIREGDKHRDTKKRAQTERRERLKRQAGVDDVVPSYLHSGRLYRSVLANLFFDL